MFTGPEEEVRQARARWLGTARNGEVDLEHFVEGLILTTGAKLGYLDNRPNDPFYFVEIPGISTIGMGVPGVPVSQSYPEDTFNEYQVPLIFFRFDTFDAALERWHPGLLQYRVEDSTAPEIPGSGGLRSRVIEKQQDAPYDLSFTLVCEARDRHDAGKVLKYLLRIFQPHSTLFVKDSLGDFRCYYMSTTSGAPEDEIFDIAEKSFGFSLPIRIMGELSTAPEFTQERSVAPPQLNLAPK